MNALLSTLVLAILTTSAMAQSQSLPGDASPVQELIGRLLPGHGGDFVIETIPAPQGQDIFEVAPGAGGKITLRGNSVLSQAVALNYYLRAFAHVSVSWYASAPVNCPAQLPPVTDAVRKSTRIRDRYFFNYCTYGYAMPWWHWPQWERMIDWMALNGINMPLAQTGNEAIWQRVWQSYGLSDDEIRAYFTGPAFLPWHRMANINQWDGPLPQDYIDGQLALQKQILARERALGMKAILPAFAGHVPEGLKRARPGIKLSGLQDSGGLPGKSRPSFLDPADPLFGEIQMKFLREQEKEMGTDHLYGMDPFNENKPPSWEPAYLASVSEAIYKPLAAVDPQGVWIQMSWTFLLKGWTPERVKAVIDSVPAGRMVMLDTVCEDTEIFRRLDSFFGAPFIWCYLGNFGSNTQIVGPIQKVDDRLTAAMNDPKLANLVGVGAMPEGLYNQYMFEAVFDRVWEGESMDFQPWFRNLARSHAGGPDPAVESAWEIMRTKVLTDVGNTRTMRGSLYQIAPTIKGMRRGFAKYEQYYHNADLVAAWRQLLNAGPVARRQDAYQFDLAQFSSQALANAALDLRNQINAAYEKEDIATYRKLVARFLEMGRDLDALLATRREFLLGNWIASARSWGRDPAESDYYERDARTIISTWGGRNAYLLDYSNRTWNGLLADYDLPRWEMYYKSLEGTFTTTADGKRVQQETDGRIENFEWQWARGIGRSEGGVFPSEPAGDVYTKSAALLKKYADLLDPAPVGLRRN